MLACTTTRHNPSADQTQGQPEKVVEKSDAKSAEKSPEPAIQVAQKPSEPITEMTVEAHPANKATAQEVKPEAAPSAPVASHEPANNSSATEEHPAPSSSPALAVAAAKTHGGHENFVGVPAEKSLGWLKNGNVRYLKRNFRADGRTLAHREKLAGGQHPHAIILSCADSRVPPELIFDQVEGEIFTIRVAGEALDSSVIASVEYAVEHLGTQLVVVMGHTQCGAVKTALKVDEGSSAGSPDLDKLLSDIRPRLKKINRSDVSASLDVESALNADGVARDLVKRSEIIRKKVEEGHLKIKSALYRIDSGKVSFY